MDIFARALLLVSTVLLLNGCATSRIADPGKITLQQALVSVAEGLDQMAQAQKRKTGLVPSEVDVTFNITASATDAGKLYVELSSIPAAGGTLKAGGEASTSISATRGNQVTIKFTNLLFADKDKLVTSKKPDEIAKLLKELFGTDIPISLYGTDISLPGRL